MVAIFTAVFLVMGIMIYFITVSLRIVTENANKKVNAYFLSKLQDYDDDFERKIEQLEELRLEQEMLAEEVEVLKRDRNSLEVSKFYKPRPVIRDTFIPTARYIDNGFFEDYKKAKTLLVMDKEQIIRAILEKFPYEGDLERYQTAASILDIFNYEALYDLYSLEEHQQLLLLDEELSSIQIKLLEEYATPIHDPGEFKLLEFFGWLKQIVDLESPFMTVYLGEEEEDYSHISQYVKCQFDKNVCEGVRIVYQHRLYDYSIYESRRKNEHVY